MEMEKIVTATTEAKLSAYIENNRLKFQSARILSYYKLHILAREGRGGSKTAWSREAAVPGHPRALRVRTLA